MPKELERKLEKEAEKKGLKGKHKNAYIYGTLRKTGWKPQSESGWTPDMSEDQIRTRLEEMGRDLDDEDQEDRQDAWSQLIDTADAGPGEEGPPLQTFLMFVGANSSSEFLKEYGEDMAEMYNDVLKFTSSVKGPLCQKLAGYLTKMAPHLVELRNGSTAADPAFAGLDKWIKQNFNSIAEEVLASTKSHKVHGAKRSGGNGEEYEKPSREQMMRNSHRGSGKNLESRIDSILEEREIQTYGAWKAACRRIKADVKFTGDKDIDGCEVGEWDGTKGVIFTKYDKKKTEGFDDTPVDKVVAEVEQYLGDVITQEMPEDAAREECWTLCIDAANDLVGPGDSARAIAKSACARLGYPSKGYIPPRSPEIPVTVPVDKLRPRPRAEPVEREVRKTGVHHGAYTPDRY